MNNNFINPRLAKKDLIALYNISYPTLRRWLRRAGLQEFIGRKKLDTAELSLIFKHLGRPLLARTAAQRLKDVYHQLREMNCEQKQFEEQYGQEAPKIKQDALEDSPEEKDYPPLYNLHRLDKKSPLHLQDAITRLRCAAIKIKGEQAMKKLQRQSQSKTNTKRIEIRKIAQNRQLSQVA